MCCPPRWCTNVQTPDSKSPTPVKVAAPEKDELVQMVALEFSFESRLSASRCNAGIRKTVTPSPAETQVGWVSI